MSLLRSRFLHNLAAVGSTRAMATILSVATFPLLVRALGVSNFGQWAYVTAVVGFLGLISNPGIGSWVLREVAAHRADAGRAVQEAFTLRLILSMVAAGLAAGLAFVAEPDGAVRTLLLTYGVPALVLSAFASDHLLGGMERFQLAAGQELLALSIYAAGILLFVHSPSDLPQLAIVSLASAATGAGFGWWISRRVFSLKLRLVPDRAWSILRTSAWYGVSSVMSQVYTRSGHLVVRWWLGEFALGLYAAAVRLVEMVYGFLNVAFGLIMPKIALYAADPPRLRRVVRLSVSLLAVVTFPFVVGGALTATTLVPQFLGAEYAPASGLVRWLLPLLATTAVASFFSGTVTYGLGRARLYFVSTLAGAITAVCLLVALVPLLGIKGACVALVLGQLAVGLTAWWSLRQDFPGVWRNPMILVATASTLLMAAVVLTLAAYSAPAAALVVAGGLIYIAAVGVLGRKVIHGQYRSVS